MSEITRCSRPPAERLSRTAELIRDHLAWQAVVSDYLAVARWRSFPRLHRRVWKLYVRQVPERAIARIVQRSKTRVHQVIEQHRRLALGRD